MNDYEITLKSGELDVPACMLWPVPSTYVQRKPLKSKYHLPRIRAWQRNRCALCGMKDHRLVEDHCHTSGLIRGLVCQGCNVVESHNNAARFVRWRAGWNPAMLLGVREDYHNIFGELVLNEQGLRLRMTDEQRAAYDRGDTVELDLVATVTHRVPPLPPPKGS